MRDVPLTWASNFDGSNVVVEEYRMSIVVWLYQERTNLLQQVVLVQHHHEEVRTGLSIYQDHSVGILIRATKYKHGTSSIPHSPYHWILEEYVRRWLVKVHHQA